MSWALVLIVDKKYDIWTAITAMESIAAPIREQQRQLAIEKKESLEKEEAQQLQEQQSQQQQYLLSNALINKYFNSLHNDIKEILSLQFELLFKNKLELKNINLVIGARLCIVTLLIEENKLNLRNRYIKYNGKNAVISFNIICELELIGNEYYKFKNMNRINYLKRESRKYFEVNNTIATLNENEMELFERYVNNLKQVCF